MFLFSIPFIFKSFPIELALQDETAAKAAEPNHDSPATG